MDGYIRVSDVGGREGERFQSPEEQRKAIEAWAQLHGVTLGELVTELDVSGARAVEERQLERLLRRVESGVSAGIVTYRVDRFSRNALDAAKAAQRLKDAHARLVGAADGLDTDTEAGRLMLAIMAQFAEAERDRRKDGFYNATGNAVARGVHVAAYAPAGYLRGEDGRLTVDPETAPFIVQAFEQRARGVSCQRIADFLSDAGVQPGGAHAQGRRWTRSGVQRMLANDAYRGVVRGQRDKKTGEQQRNEKAHEPLVSAELFAAVQTAKRALPVERNGQPTRAGEVGLLTGLIRCASCGNLLRRRVGTERHGATYACYRHFATPCEAPAAILVSRADEYVARAIAESEDEQVLALGNAEQRHVQARLAVEQAERELDELADLELRRALGAERHGRMVAQAEQALREAQAELHANPNPGLPTDATIVGSRFAYEAVGEDIERDRAWIRRYVRDVRLASAGRRQNIPASERLTIRWTGEPV